MGGHDLPKITGQVTEHVIRIENNGALRNTRKVYRDLPDDLPGPIIYWVFWEIDPWTEMGL